LIKVLIVGPDRADPGGVANYYNAVFPNISNDEITAHYLQIGSTHGKLKGVHLITDQFRFWVLVRQLQPDVIHLNPSLDLKSFLRDGLFIILAKLTKRRVLVFFRGWQEEFETKVGKYFHWFLKLSYLRSDAFIVLAEKFSTTLKGWGVKAPIYLGTTTVANELLNDFSVSDKVKDIKDTKTISLLYLARLEREKGVLQLIDAVRILLEKGKIITLSIAGDGALMKEVESAVNRLGEYSDNVKILGYVRGKEKIELFRQHHIFCFPTQYGEGMPNSVLEAIAFGLPVVTCAVGGIADFFEDGKMGILLESQDPQHIAKHIESLIQDPDDLASIAVYNNAYAKNHFLATISAKMLRDTYIDMMIDK